MRWVARVFAVTCAVVPSTVQAQRSLGTLDVQMTLVSGCEFSAGSENAGISQRGALLDFGTMTDPSRPLDATAFADNAGATLGIACSTSHVAANAPTVSIDGGSHRQGSERRMAAPGGNYAPYLLYRDPARNEPYDPDVPVQLTIPTAGIFVPVAIYARVPRPANLADGTYTDTITITLTY